VTTLGLPEKLNDIRLDKAELDRIQKTTGSKFLTSDKKPYMNMLTISGSKEVMLLTMKSWLKWSSNRPKS